VTPNNTSGAIQSYPGIYICPGDYDVANGNYVVWGYAHADTGLGGDDATAEAQAYLDFLTNEDQPALRENGLVEPCEMNVARTFDAGPYSLATSTC
jgi:hypothetical protein